MARRKASNRSRDRRGSGPGRVAAPAHLRREAAKVPREVTRAAPAKQAQYRAAMVREVSADLRGIITAPNRAPQRVERETPLQARGVQAVQPKPARTIENRPSVVTTERKPKVTRSETKSETKLKVQPTCKPRPTQSKGDGTSRRFIPWCDRK